MFVLMVYDVDVKRVSKALKVARRYLRRVQNSVFEGELTESRLAALKADLGHILDLEYDNVLLYTWKNRKHTTCEGMGVYTGFATGEAVNFI